LIPLRPVAQDVVHQNEVSGLEIAELNISWMGDNEPSAVPKSKLENPSQRIGLIVYSQDHRSIETRHAFVLRHEQDFDCCATQNGLTNGALRRTLAAPIV
jgi:hypothetical protein